LRRKKNIYALKKKNKHPISRGKKRGFEKLVPVFRFVFAGDISLMTTQHGRDQENRNKKRTEQTQTDIIFTSSFYKMVALLLK
jgi:hypothetical protein